MVVTFFLALNLSVRPWGLFSVLEKIESRAKKNVAHAVQFMMECNFFFIYDIFPEEGSYL